MRFNFPIPKTDDDFEHLCCQLLKRHWNRPHLQRYAHKGESQDGVDIHDPSQTKPIHAAQCKLHDYGKTIPPKEIEEEVEKAKKHRPPIEHYAILTTGKKSKQADKKVAEINQRHQEQRLFSVEVLTWDQIEILLEQSPDVRDPIYFPAAAQFSGVVSQGFSALQIAIEATTQTSTNAIDAELDGIKTEIDQHEIDVASRLAERLEERNGDKLSPRQRWRLLTLKANVCLQRGEFEQAASYLFRAKDEQPAEEKALVNEALAFELMRKLEEAHALATSLLARSSHSSDAAGIWVRTAPEDVPTTQMEEAVARFIHTNGNVALALASRALERGEVVLAERHARRAAELDVDAPQMWLMVAQTIHARAMKEARQADLPALLREAENYYSKAVELAHAQRIIHIEAAACVNRAVARSVLGDKRAEEDFIIAGRLRPGEADFMRKHAVHLFLVNEADRAIQEARAALAAEPGEESALLLAAGLWDRGGDNDRKEALDLCLEIVRGGSQARFDDALEMAIAGLSKFARHDEANQLLKSLPGERLSDVGHNTFLAEIALSADDKAGAESLAGAAQAKVRDETTPIEIRRLCRILMRANLHELAMPLLQRIARLHRFDVDAQMLLDCANRLKDDHVILTACRTLRESGVEDRQLLDNEIDILQQYDRSEAIRILQDFLGRNPDDRLARLRLSILGLQSDRPDIIVSEPDKLPRVEEAQPETVGFAVVRVLYLTERRMEALKYAYDLLRVNMDDPEAHLLYCGLIIQGEPYGWQFESPVSVESDAAVSIQEEGASQIQVFIVEDQNPQPQLNEYSRSHPRIERMLGKKVGETISLSNSGFQERIARVVSVQSKYVFRFQNCMDQFQIRFPEKGAELQRFQLAKDEAHESPMDLRPIIDALEKQRKQIQRLMHVYRTQPTPVRLLSDFVGKDTIETMGYLTSQPNEGVRWCCFGTPLERERAMIACRENFTTVLDVTALFTLWRLGLSQLLGRWESREFVISQSTCDALHLFVESETSDASRVTNANRGWMGMDERGHLIFREVSAAELARRAESFQQFEEHIASKCTVVTVREVADLAPEQRETLIRLFGRDGVESIALGARPNSILWADDLTLHAHGKQEFASLRWGWTQAILQVACDGGIISTEQFCDYSARLIGFGYSFTWFNVETILQAGSIADWNCEAWPLYQVIRKFGLERVPPNVKLPLAANSIVRIFRNVDSPFRRQAFIIAIQFQ